MKKRLLFASALLGMFTLVLAIGRSRSDDDDVIHLFNGKDLTNFYTFLKGYGKNNDPKKVFTVKDGMIHVSGEVYGGLITEKEYENYHLIVEFKWGEKTYPPRKDKARDSGILLHCVGEDGARGGVWMESIECQIIEGGTGDFILVAGKNKPSLTVEAEKRDGGLYYKKGAKPITLRGGRCNWFGRDPKWKDVVGFRGANDVEKPVGEWNRVECICKGDSITNIVNGTVVNHGTKASPSKGKILFQSEGAELFFRKIDLKPLK
ncbi:MAG: hypothetical protein KatS3mg105_3847 [Gemmatales bacterium]|nr:MAG: hypothetical protein KatS3mg105_3847 [Gemmatales bacterium]